MRFSNIAVVLATACILGGPALAQPPAAAPDVSPAAAAKLGPTSTFKELVANPKAKAILEAEVPVVIMALDMGIFPDTATLKAVAAEEAAQTGAGLTPEVYAKIVAELAKL